MEAASKQNRLLTTSATRETVSQKYQGSDSVHRKLNVVDENSTIADSTEILSPSMLSPNKPSSNNSTGPTTPTFNPSGAPQTPKKGEFMPPTPTATHTMAVVDDDVKRCSDTGIAEMWCSCHRCEHIMPDERHWARGVVDRKGRTPLHNACIWGEEERVLILLRAAMKDEEIAFRQKTVDKEGCTVLHCGAPYPGVLELLFSMHKFDLEFICLHERKFGYTALHRAAQAGASKSVSILVERGISKQALDSKGRTPLHLAARSGHVECSKRLIELGANVSASDGKDHNSIQYAMLFGQNEVVQMMEAHVRKSRQKQRSSTSGGSMAVRQTGRAKNANSLKALLEKRQVEKKKQSSAMTSTVTSVMTTKDIVPDAHTLQQMSGHGSHEEVAMLLKKAKVKDTDIMLTHDREKHRIAFHFAAAAGHVEVIANLLRHQPYGGKMGGGHSSDEIAKKQLKHQDIKGYTPFHLAIENRHEEVVMLLVQMDTPMDISTHRGELPLHFVGQYGSQYKRNSLLRIIRAHCAAGLDIDHCDSVGKTALNYAAEANSVKAVELLIDNGATLYNPGKGTKDTPAHTSARSNFGELTEFLIDLRPNLYYEFNNEGWTPLHEASLHGCYQAAKAIIDAGFDPDMKPKHYAPPSEALHPGFLASPRAESVAAKLTGTVRPSSATLRFPPRKP